MFYFSPERWARQREKLLRLISAFLAIGIIILGAFIIFACMYLYLAELHSEFGVPVGISILVVPIIALVVIMVGYTSYRLVRFALRGA